MSALLRTRNVSLSSILFVVTILLGVSWADLEAGASQCAWSDSSSRELTENVVLLPNKMDSLTSILCSLAVLSGAVRTQTDNISSYLNPVDAYSPVSLTSFKDMMVLTFSVFGILLAVVSIISTGPYSKDVFTFGLLPYWPGRYVKVYQFALVISIVGIVSTGFMVYEYFETGSEPERTYYVTYTIYWIAMFIFTALLLFFSLIKAGVTHADEEESPADLSEVDVSPDVLADPSA